MHAIFIFPALLQANLPTVDVGEAGAQLTGMGQDRFGFQSASGDLDGDGRIDLVVTAPHQGTDGNSVYVFSGPDLVLDGGTALDAGDAMIDIHGEGGDETGWSVAVGDVIGDESLDLIIGSPSVAGGNGAVQVFEGPIVPGSYSTFDATHTVHGVTFGYAGWSVAAGDFDGDGKDELAAGGCFVATYAGTGQVWVLDLDENPPETTDGATTTFEGGGLTGCSLANAGDFNGDAYEDLLVGSHGNAAMSMFPYGGMVSLVYGRPSFAPSHDLRTDPVAMDIANIVGEHTGANLGFDIAPAGDLNFDGYDDFLIGSPGVECGLCLLPTTSHVYVMLGTPDVAPGGGMGRGLIGTSKAHEVSDLIFDNARPYDHTGISVSGAGWVGPIYGDYSHPLMQPIAGFGEGLVMLMGTGDDIAYAIPYDLRARLFTAPEFDCVEDGETSTWQCTIDWPEPYGPRMKRIPLDSLTYGGHIFTGEPGSVFGFEVLGPGALDDDGLNDLFFGATHQLAFGDPAGEGQAFVFAGM